MTKLRAALPSEVVAELDRLRRHVAVVEPVREYETPLLRELLRASLDEAYLKVAYDSIEYTGRVRGMIYVHNRHRSYLHGVLQYEDMGGSLMSKVMFKASRSPRDVSDVRVVLLLCLIVCLILLSLPARGSQDPSALGMNNVLPVQRAPVNAPSLDGSYYPFALAEEAEDEAVNAGLLTMLFLAASFLGASVGWLLTKAQGQGALRCSSLGVGEVLGSAGEEYLPFLRVFRL